MEIFRFTLAQGEAVLDHLLKKGIGVSHDCGGTLACASCRVVVREGLERLNAASADEIDMLDRAGTAGAGARLACQALGAGEIEIEVPSVAAPSMIVASPIRVSERAAQYFAGQLAKHPGAVAVRLGVKRAGCTGFGYQIDPATAIRDDDAIFEAGAVRVVVDSLDLPYLQGMTVDVVQDGLSRRLRFDNPNAQHSCGCGESFSV
jgi:iron-sulfur cluster assembly protein